MGISTHVFRVAEARRTNHPVFNEVEKYWFTVPARYFPTGISTAANARDPVGLNRRVYRDVRESLEAKASMAGTFDLMNKGITILATDVRLVDKAANIFEVSVDDDIGGIVDGAHTAKIIEECNSEGMTPPEQHVEVYIRTKLKGPIITDIARGLNTGMQVAPKSIYNIDHVFDWLKATVAKEPYSDRISWKESDAKDYDVRDLIAILEMFNIFDWPNDSGKHPIAAYEKWSIPLDKFADDFEKNRDHLSESKYFRLRGILRDGLVLFDHVRKDFYDIHKAAGGSAGKMNIVEEASEKKKTFDFPFAQLPPHKYRLTKGAAYPIVAAFRNYVTINPETDTAVWIPGFQGVLDEWQKLAPELVQETFNATKEIGRMPDQLGKNRKHWDNLHMKVQLRLLRAELLARRRSDETTDRRRGR